MDASEPNIEQSPASWLELIRQAGYGEDELGSALVRLAQAAAATEAVEAELEGELAEAAPGARVAGRAQAREVGR